MIRHLPSRRVLAALAISVSALAFAACAETTPGSAFDLTGRVTFEVTEGGTPSPLGGALVRFTSDTGQVHEATSGSDGRYALSVFTDSEFGQVRAEAAGFLPAERTVYFDVGERRIDLVLRRDPAAPAE